MKVKSKNRMIYNNQMLNLIKLNLNNNKKRKKKINRNKK